MATLDSPRSLAAAALALVAAVVLVRVAGGRSDASRLTDLDVGSSEIPSLYVRLDERQPGRCYITDRQGSTTRRSDDPRAGRPGELVRGEVEPGSLDPWMIRSKREGTFLLVPAFDVYDWAFPYAYRFARDRRQAEELPSVEWVRLYLNRIYQGVYLKIELPADRQGGGALLPELLIASGARIACTDIRLDETCRIYPDLVAQGRLPSTRPPSEDVRWLFSLSPVDERMLVVEPEEPFHASWLPLPVSFRETYRRITGRELQWTSDERALRWTRTDGDASPSSGRADLDSGWPAYRERLEAALRVHCEYHQCIDRLEAELPRRLTPSWSGAGAGEIRSSR
jgi:hypothetical protein